MAEGPSPAALLELLPQRPPFRFVDEILSVDEERIIAAHTFRADADYYRGHFPGRPVTPGVLVIEAMAQAGVAAHGTWLLARAEPAAAAAGLLTLFTDARVAFHAPVPPGARVLVTGTKLWLRRRKLRSQVEARLEDGLLVAAGELAGMAVPR